MEYAILILLIYLTGSPYFVTFYYSNAVIMSFIIVFIYFVKTHFHKFYLHKVVNLVVLFMFISLTITVIVNSESELQSYIAIALQLLISYMFVIIFDYKKFLKMYINCISIIALISIVFYSVLLMYPGIMLYFPQSPNTNSLVYHNAIVHLFSRANGFSYFFPFLRNHSIFWEPGSYQAFLNLGILFLLESINIKSSINNSKRYLSHFLILSVAVVTTYSTTGYLIYAMLLFFYRKQVKHLLGSSMIKRLTILPILVLGLFLISKWGIPLSYIIDKIGNEFGSELSFLNRIYLDDLKLLTYDNNLNFWGISFSKYKEIERQSANSIIHTLVVLGTPFTVILLALYYKFSRLLNKSFVAFIMLTMIFSTQSLIWRPLFVSLGLYGLTEDKNNFKRKEHNTNTIRR